MTTDYWAYFKAVLRHKRHVYRAGRTRGVGVWQLLVHDLSKFRPDEFVPYARWFNGRDGGPWGPVLVQARAAAGQEVSPTVQAVFREAEQRHRDFMQAFLLHLHRNPHHHQYWRLPSHGDKPGRVFEMPVAYVLEMLADWDGAGLAYAGGEADTRAWYLAQKDIVLGPETRRLVEGLLEIGP